MRVLIAGGGTGGHLYPALAMAEAVQKKAPHAQIHFVGTKHGLETKIVPKANFPLHFISVGKLNQVSMGEKIETLLMLPFAIVQSLLLILRLKPNVILGVGGYASGPVLLVGALLRYRTMIWEPNAYPGLANRWLSRVVDLCCVVFEEAVAHLRPKKWLKVAMPVRKEIEELGPRVPTQANFRILVFGGSQGSRVLNNTILEWVKKGGPWLRTTEIVHQTGATDFRSVREAYDSIPHTKGVVECREYLDDMPQRYQWADLVICRSGTGTLSEIAACGKAAILVPLPTAADDHQRKNAEALVRKGAARMITQSELTVDRLQAEIDDLRHHPEKIAEIEERVKQFHVARAAEHMADLILGNG